MFSPHSPSPEWSIRFKIGRHMRTYDGWDLLRRWVLNPSDPVRVSSQVHLTPSQIKRLKREGRKRLDPDIYSIWVLFVQLEPDLRTLGIL